MRKIGVAASKQEYLAPLGSSGQPFTCTLIRCIGGRMTTNTRLQGSLREFGLVEVLQMMELSGMTGAIHLKQMTGRIGIVYFQDGKLASCSELDAGALTLGDVLQQLSMATSAQIERAFSQQLQNPSANRIA